MNTIQFFQTNPFLSSVLRIKYISLNASCQSAWQRAIQIIERVENKQSMVCFEHVHLSRILFLDTLGLLILLASASLFRRTFINVWSFSRGQIEVWQQEGREGRPVFIHRKGPSYAVILEKIEQLMLRWKSLRMIDFTGVDSDTVGLLPALMSYPCFAYLLWLSGDYRMEKGGLWELIFILDVFRLLELSRWCSWSGTLLELLLGINIV